MFNFKLT